ncbi:trypsin Inhibitor like cysteine rich domain protein [Ostertagia ostertagi]
MKVMKCCWLKSGKETKSTWELFPSEKEAATADLRETPQEAGWRSNLTDNEKLLLLLGFCFIADPQQLCRRNERYAECGRCEATCKNPNTGCRHGCLPSRCECIAALNYVRDRHGACIKITDCDVPTMLVAFESGGAFRKIFGKLYNEGKVEDAGRTGTQQER